MADPKLNENLLDEELEAGEEEQEEKDLHVEEEQEEEQDSEEEKGDESDEEEEKDDDKDGDEDKDDEGDSDEEEIPEKFKGKSLKDVIKSYQELEGMIDRKAMEKAQEYMGKGANDEDKKKTDAQLQDELEDLEKKDFSKMSPKDFAKWMDRRIEIRATQIARDTYNSSTKISQNVQIEIREAQKVYPQLKENKDFREMVLTVIESASQKGEVVTLKEACEKVAKAVGIKPADPNKKPEEKKPEGEEKKKPRTGVEKPRGAESGKEKTDEEKVRDELLGGGSKKGALGGLGL